MTEQRAKEMLQQIAYDGEYPMGSTDAFNMAIKALEEIQQYRALGLTPELIEAMQGHNIAMINDLAEYQALGTVEELRVARDKQIPKMPKIWANGTKHCPNEDCEEVIYTSDNYCLKCGQKLNWEEVRR